MEELRIRRSFVLREVVRREAGRTVEEPRATAVAAVVIESPWARAGFVEDLEAVRDDAGAALGRLLADAVVDAVDAPVAAYGKAAVVGTGGELEHASALIHTLRFGDPLRERVGATTLLPAVEKRAAPGQPFDIPLRRVLPEGQRPYHQTITVTVADAPHPDELVVALAVATGSRPLARLAE